MYVCMYVCSMYVCIRSLFNRPNFRDVCRAYFKLGWRQMEKLWGLLLQLFYRLVALPVAQQCISCACAV